MSEDWRSDAACLSTDPEAFFPSPTDATGIALAVAICSTCPVREACGQWAMATRQRDGVWGGMGEVERERLRQRRMRARWQR